MEVDDELLLGTEPRLGVRTESRPLLRTETRMEPRKERVRGSVNGGGIGGGGGGGRPLFAMATDTLNSESVWICDFLA